MNWSQKRLKPLQLGILSGALATTTSLSLFVPVWCHAVRAALQDSPKTIVDETWQIVNREYVDPNFNSVDWQEIRHRLLNKEYTSKEQAYTAIRQALRQLDDPYTRFLDPKQFADLTDQTSGELSGVGMSLELDAQTQAVTVVEPYENSPAIKAGIQQGDRILAVDGKSTEGMSVSAVAKLIRGEVGTSVKLEISRGDLDIFEVELTRARVEIPTVTYELKQEDALNIGYIRLEQFSSHAAEQMKRSILKLEDKKVDAFVLDLRGNPGGLLSASIEIARMWMNTGPIVRTVDRQGKSEALRANRTALTERPLVVLVDSKSASSSEILTGALQDNQRAKVIGTKTFGKALVQAVHSLSDGSGVAVTIAHYYTPKGTDISTKGITPDIEIETTTNPRLMATVEDLPYVRAIATLKTEVSPTPLAIKN